VPERDNEMVAIYLGEHFKERVHEKCSGPAAWTYAVTPTVLDALHEYYDDIIERMIKEAAKRAGIDPSSMPAAGWVILEREGERYLINPDGKRVAKAWATCINPTDSDDFIMTWHTELLP